MEVQLLHPSQSPEDPGYISKLARSGTGGEAVISGKPDCMHSPPRLLRPESNIVLAKAASGRQRKRAVSLWAGEDQGER